MTDDRPTETDEPASGTTTGEAGAADRSTWTRAAAGKVARTAETVTEPIEPPETDPATAVHVWDTWLLRTRHGAVATPGGWRILFCLTAPADVLPGTRHDVATIRYFYSADGRTWTDGGRLFDDALGQRQWAGSAVYVDSEQSGDSVVADDTEQSGDSEQSDDSEASADSVVTDDGAVYVYYTAAGDETAAELTYTQRIAMASGARLVTTSDGVRFDGSWDHSILLEPDGSWYERPEQARGLPYTFRDPWFYEDPATGRTHLLFEANTPTAPSTPDDRAAFNGAVGVAVSPDGDPTRWELRPPLLDAVTVNQELERPHVVRADGRYYLFVSSHDHTFAPGVAGYDGLYGFVADSLRGAYRPLNDSGLVVTNPATAPFQAYSWMAFPHDGELLVQSFTNYHAFDGSSLDAVADLPPTEQRRRFGGTLAPTIRLTVNADRTRIRGRLDSWEIPAGDDSLPPPDRETPPPAALENADADDAPDDAGSQY